ncbi:hypothetical protein AWV80_23835 [Cupriavidus sp. UYMU48A]|nr:hypothetical protein AWV80_23835 [Cupriavidus sp. UYMU48A]
MLPCLRRQEALPHQPLDTLKFALRLSVVFGGMPDALLCLTVCCTRRSHPCFDFFAFLGCQRQWRKFHHHFAFTHPVALPQADPHQSSCDRRGNNVALPTSGLALLARGDCHRANGGAHHVDIHWLWHKQIAKACRNHNRAHHQERLGF